jgi:hypothetical protein
MTTPFAELPTTLAEAHALILALSRSRPLTMGSTLWVAVLPHPAEAGIRAQNAFAAIVLSGNGGHCAAASVIFSVANSITFVQISSLLTLLATWRLRAQRAPPLGRNEALWLSLSSIPFARGRTCSRRADSSLLQATARKVVANYS